MIPNDPDLTRNSDADEADDAEGHKVVEPRAFAQTDEADDSEGHRFGGPRVSQDDEADDSEGHRFGSPRISPDSDEADDSPGQLTRGGH
ncbi:MAG: hypothetical protein WA695_00635 [Candidatus Dormiibacterota bacterium]